MQLRCSLCEAPQKVRGGDRFLFDRFLTDLGQIFDRFLTDLGQIFDRFCVDLPETVDRLFTDFSQMLNPTSRQVTDF